jgi:hypothetical protein
MDRGSDEKTKEWKNRSQRELPLRGLNGSTTFPDYFAFWNANEPNQYNGAQEDYAHHRTLEACSWNDLTNGDSGGNYQPKGYIVEYGGTNDDPVLKNSKYYNNNRTNNKYRFVIKMWYRNITLQAAAAGGTIRWYDSASGGTP